LAPIAPILFNLIITMAAITRTSTAVTFRARLLVVCIIKQGNAAAERRDGD